MKTEIKTVILAADHAGYELKEGIKKYVQDQGYSVLDVGASELTPDDDYPVYMSQAAMHVAKDMAGTTRALIFGGSGQGEAMVANRFPGVRATVWYGGGICGESDIIRLSREHNDANVLSIGARFVTLDDTKKAVDLWLKTPFSGDAKHARRNLEIDSIE